MTAYLRELLGQVCVSRSVLSEEAYIGSSGHNQTILNAVVPIYNPSCNTAKFLLATLTNSLNFLPFYLFC